MYEVYYEESATVANPTSAKRKYNIGKILSILSYCLTFVWFLIFLIFYGLSNVVIDLIVLFFPIITFIAIGIVIGKVKNTFYQEYDYAFVSGSVRVAKVFNMSKRRFLFEFNCDAIEKLGEYGSETYNQYANMPGVKTQILTPNDLPGNGKNFYYIVVNINADKKLLVFECTKTFMLNVLKFSKKTVLEKE